jgi:hypothetical protein
MLTEIASKVRGDRRKGMDLIVSGVCCLFKRAIVIHVLSFCLFCTREMAPFPPEEFP